MTQNDICEPDCILNKKQMVLTHSMKTQAEQYRAQCESCFVGLERLTLVYVNIVCGALLQQIHQQQHYSDMSL